MARPMVTYAMPCYRQAEFVEQALMSALAQDYQPLQIVIVDDASPDDSYRIISRLVKAYQGPHEVIVRRNRTNRGVETYNRLMKLARGNLIVIGHCDDIVMPHRVSRIVQRWEATGASVLSSNAIVIDREGREGALFTKSPDMAFDAAQIAEHGWRHTMHGATLAWERAVFDVFGGLARDRSAVATD